MLFHTSEFIFLFLPAAVALHFILARFSVGAAIVATTVTSLAFYTWWKPPFVALPVLSILANFYIARQIARVPEAAARRLLIIGIVANLAVLGWFKYADFVVSIFHGRKPGVPEVPLALSFTTFVQIAFLVDVWRRRASVAVAPYAMFVAFFPHLIAGPIVRWSELGPQIADKLRYRVDWNNIALGLTIFTLGLSKKVLIADRLAPHVAPVFEAAASGVPLTAIAAWGAALAYSAQLYFDFSGYSDMAVGLGLLFNLRLPINFAAPFRATSIIDLWRRWHISLSRFLRDFVYVPLGGGARGPARRTLNLFATMTLGGLWHGANWTFIAWGAFHGVLLALNHAWRLARGKREPTRAGRAAGWLATFIAFVVGMVFFRAADIGAAGQMLRAMAGFGNAPHAESIHVAWDLWGIRVGYISEDFVRAWLGGHWSVIGTLLTAGALAVAFLIPDTMELTDYREGEPHTDWRRRVGALAWRPSVPWLVVLALLFGAVFANLLQFTEFLYYQF
jgi:D-alanyl-lipoteichoic acid acyltransferase DltB (MBOAT superfamily)